jgi:hypothetical protein
VELKIIKKSTVPLLKFSTIYLFQNTDDDWNHSETK